MDCKRKGLGRDPVCPCEHCAGNCDCVKEQKQHDLRIAEAVLNKCLKVTFPNYEDCPCYSRLQDIDLSKIIEEADGE